MKVLQLLEKRFEKINLENTENNRRNYRELLFHTSLESSKYIGGVILYEETLFQKDNSGKLFSEILKENGIVIGIKVDQGLFDTPTGQITQGLDDLNKRVERYYKAGARFAKWRAAYSIKLNEEEQQPNDLIIELNSSNLAKYASICQLGGLIPIIEPEVLVTETKNLSFKKSYEITKKVLQITFKHLFLHNIDLKRIILKPNMILSTLENLSHKEIAEATIFCLKETVPSIVPTIMFLSGGQTEEEAVKNLNEINKVNQLKPWYLSFSYGRALQDSCIKTWKGDQNNVKNAQLVYLEKAKKCYLAAQGKLE